MTITEFLLARLADDEQRARDAICQCGGPVCTPDLGFYREDELNARLNDNYDEENPQPAAATPHILAWSPARVLAECQAKRAIIQNESWWDEHQQELAGMTDDELHDRRQHPAYEYATTEGQRKAWDDEDVPPEGEGWERNRTASNPQAWERFDYTEEAYWRRLRPEGPRKPPPPTLALRALAAVYKDHPDFDPAWSTP